jgi:hypothetical protein
MLKTSVRGTFSPAALQGFGSSAPIERIATAAEKTAKNTAKTAELLEDGDEFE